MKIVDNYSMGGIIFIISMVLEYAELKKSNKPDNLDLLVLLVFNTISSDVRGFSKK